MISVTTATPWLSLPCRRSRAYHHFLTASGRCLRSVETFLQERVLPTYGNTHTLATCAENFGCAVAALALGIESNVIVFIAGLLSALSIDMAARSLSHKLRARC